MSLWSTFNSLSVRGYGVGIGNNFPIPPGTLITSSTGVLYDYASNGSKFIVTNSKLTTFTPYVIASYDEINWYQDLLPQGNSTNYQIVPDNIFYFNGLWLMYYRQNNPSYAGFYYSNDSITWTKVTSNLPNIESTRAITDGTYAVLALRGTGAGNQSLARVLYTSDGININYNDFTITGSTINQSYMNYANNLYIYTFNSTTAPLTGIYTSSTINGTFTSRTLPSDITTNNGNIVKVIYYNGLYYVLGKYFISTTPYSVLFSTSNFSTYTTIGTYVNTNILDFINTNGIFIYSGVDSTSNYRIWSSATGSSLTSRYLGCLSNNIKYEPSIAEYIIPGQNTSNQSVLLTSPDGTTWTRRV
jgi:hypothetical protein